MRDFAYVTPADMKEKKFPKQINNNVFYRYFAHYGYFDRARPAKSSVFRVR